MARQPLLPSENRIGRIQRAIRRAFIACPGARLRTVDLAAGLIGRNLGSD
jgi:hypothetical protein